MEASAMAVAVLFGLAMGWGLSRFLTDHRPVVTGLGFGLLCGVVVAAFDLTADPVFVGRSLTMGCAAALVAVAATWVATRRPSASPSPRS